MRWPNTGDVPRAAKRKSRSLALATGSASDKADICEKLLAHCKGHPHARVAWPHRVLHEAREEIERLRAAIEWALGMGKDGFRPRMDGEGAYWWRTELRRRALPNVQSEPDAQTRNFSTSRTEP